MPTAHAKGPELLHCAALEHHPASLAARVATGSTQTETVCISGQGDPSSLQTRHPVPRPAPNLGYHTQSTRKTEACKTGLKKARAVGQSKESQRAAWDRGRRHSPWEEGVVCLSASKELVLSGVLRDSHALSLQRGTLVYCLQARTVVSYHVRSY